LHVDSSSHLQVLPLAFSTIVVLSGDCHIATKLHR
jgi:hypothetical protein